MQVVLQPKIRALSSILRCCVIACCWSHAAGSEFLLRLLSDVQAIATAVAQGGDSQAAVAEATAQAMCAGGSTASAWASAYAVALSTDARGCLVLNEAKAMARARCGPSGAESFARSQTNSLVLGFCGLMDLIPGLGGINLGGWSGGNAGSSTTGESGFANGNGFGATGNPYSFNSLPDDAGSTGDYNSDYAGLNGGRR